MRPAKSQAPRQVMGITHRVAHNGDVLNLRLRFNVAGSVAANGSSERARAMSKSHLSRRQFMNRSLAAAGVGAGFAIGGTKSSGRVIGANDTVRARGGRA